MRFNWQRLIKELLKKVLTYIERNVFIKIMKKIMGKEDYRLKALLYLFRALAHNNTAALIIL